MTDKYKLIKSVGEQIEDAEQIAWNKGFLFGLLFCSVIAAWAVYFH